MIAAVLDADVLFPNYLRDTLLLLAEAELYRLHWSARILDEMERNIAIKAGIGAERAARTRGLIERAFAEGEVEVTPAADAAMRNHPKDRHVAAAAVAAEAGFIVTNNLKDFYDLPEAVHAVSPDVFLSDLLATTPDVVLATLGRQAARHQHAPRTVSELLKRLSLVTPVFAVAAQRALERT